MNQASSLEKSTDLKLLFVDDEEFVLRALTRSLRKMRYLDITCTSSARDAMAQLETKPFDVVISDLNMPEEDGRELLTRIKGRWPETVRIILTGSSPDVAKRLDQVAHQVLTKPWSVESLIECLARLYAVSSLLTDSRLRSETGGLDALPGVPEHLFQLNRVLADEAASASDIANIVSRDAALAAKVLQLANSAFFGMRSISTSDIPKAVVHLGTNTISAIATSLAIEREFDGNGNIAGFDIDTLQVTATMTARLAHGMFADKQLRDDAFAGGLLQDVGQLVLANTRAEAFEHLLQESQQSGSPLHEVERTRFGVTHADIGAYLLGAWGLRTPVVEAVANRYQAMPSGEREFGVPDAVYVASRLIAAARTGDPPVEQAVDAAWLEELGMGAKLEGWCQAALDIAKKEPLA